MAIHHEVLNINKLFMKAVAKFFVHMDTLKEVIKRLKRLVLKLHHYEQLLQEQLDDAQQEPSFDNFMDEDIPKRLRVVVEEGLSVVLVDPSKKLAPFLAGGDSALPHLQHAVLNTQ